MVTKNELTCETKTKKLFTCVELSTLLMEQGSFCSDNSTVTSFTRLTHQLSWEVDPAAIFSSDTMGKQLPKARSDHVDRFFFSDGLCKKQ